MGGKRGGSVVGALSPVGIHIPTKLVCFYSNPSLSRKRVSSKNHKRSRANSHGDKRGGCSFYTLLVQVQQKQTNATKRMRHGSKEGHKELLF